MSSFPVSESDYVPLSEVPDDSAAVEVVPEETRFPGTSPRTTGESIEAFVPTAAYEGLIRGATMIPDLGVTLAKVLLDLGVSGLQSAIGKDNLPAILDNAADSFLASPAVSIGDIAVGGFNLAGEGAKALERFLLQTYNTEALEKIGVDPEKYPVSDYGFTTSRPAPVGLFERSLDTSAMMAGMGASFPVNPVAWALWLKKLGAGDRAAAEALTTARTSKNPLSALSKGINELGKRYQKQYTQSPVYKTAQETALGTVAGLGFQLPELFQDDRTAPIWVNLPGGEKLDVKPTLQMLSSMMGPVLLSVGPMGILSDPDVAGPLARLADKFKNLGRGFGAKGREELASKILYKLMDDEEAASILVKAVEDGWIVSPYSNTSRLILTSDGQLIPREAALTPDTTQALRELGVSNVHMNALQEHLIQSSGGASYVKEVLRRQDLVDEFLVNIKTRLGAEGAPEDAAKFVDQQVTKLADVLQEQLDLAVAKAKHAVEFLEPQYGRDEAAKIGRTILDDQHNAARRLEKQFWDEDNIGTDTIDASGIGAFAAKAIETAGRNRFKLPPILYILAGRNRLHELGIGKRGEPLPRSQLPESPDSPGQKIDPDLIPVNGRYDVHSGTATENPVTIPEIQGLRSQLRLEQRAFRKADNKQAARELEQVIKEIDNNVLTEENILKTLDPQTQTIRPPVDVVANLRAAIQFSRRLTELYEKGPVGKVLKGEVPPEKFWDKLLEKGVGANVPIVAYKEALLEPVLSPENLARVGTDPSVSIFKPSDIRNVPVEKLDSLRAELLGRLAERVPVTLKPDEIPTAIINRFLRDKEFGHALDQVPNLRTDIQNYKEVREAVEIIQHRMKNPSPKQIQTALENGAKLTDITDAARLRGTLLKDENEINAASLILGIERADWKNAIRNFMQKGNEKQASELRRLVDTDETGAALKGVRTGIFRELVEQSQKTDARTKNTFADLSLFARGLAKNRFFAEKFFDKTQMAILDEITEGALVQRPGIDAGKKVGPSVTDPARLGAGEAEKQVVSAAGRGAGGKLFHKVLGINPLVGTALGRSIAEQVHYAIGRDPILKLLDNAMKDPVEAVRLINIRKNLADWEDVAKLKSGQIVEGARGKLSQTMELLHKLKESRFHRLAQLGLIGGLHTSRRLSVEEDWEYGPPFVHPENDLRWEIVNKAKPPKSRVVPTVRPLGLSPHSSLEINQTPVPSSLLSQVSPVLAREGGGAPVDRQQYAALFPRDIANPVMAAEGGMINGGILSVCPPKKRQMVS